MIIVGIRGSYLGLLVVVCDVSLELLVAVGES